MKSSRLIDIQIFITSRCDRGCRHCMFKSNNIDPIDFNPDMAELLVKRLAESNTKAIIHLTGGGEPLMNTGLPDIVQKLCTSPTINSCRLITSGFIANEKEKDRLAKAISVGNGKLSVNLSFHHFMKK